VAKIRPDRYVTSGSDVKIVASKSIKFYKYPSSTTTNPLNQRSKWIFHIGRTSITNCSCDTRHLTAADSHLSSVDGENFVVMGRLERVGNRGRRVGEHQHKPRLELTSIAVFDSRSKEFRRALRAIKDADACGGPYGLRAPDGPPTTAPRMWTNDDRGMWQKGGQRRQQHAALSATDLGGGGSGSGGGGESRKLIRLNKKLRKRAERIRARKGGRHTEDVSSRVSWDYVERVVDNDDDSRRQRLQPSSQPPARQHRQSRVQQQPADEATIMANRRDRIERRKSTASPVHRSASRRNNRNDGVQRNDAL